MKRVLSFLILFILLLGCKDTCDKKVISKGKINEKWEYSNQDLGIRLKLPSNWFITDVNSNQVISIKGNVPENILGNDTIKIKSTFDVRRGGLDISEIFKILDSKPKQRTFPEEVIHTNEIRFGIIHSKYQDEEKDIEDMRKEFEKLFIRDKDLYKYNKDIIKNTRKFNFGNAKIPCLKMFYRKGDGKIQTQIASIKNYGCFNLMIIADYQNEKNLASIISIMNKINN